MSCWNAGHWSRGWRKRCHFWLRLDADSVPVGEEGLAYRKGIKGVAGSIPGVPIQHDLALQRVP